MQRLFTFSNSYNIIVPYCNITIDEAGQIQSPKAEWLDRNLILMLARLVHRTPHNSTPLWKLPVDGLISLIQDTALTVPLQTLNATAPAPFPPALST